MGAAKLRGTFEERRDLAIAKQIDADIERVEHLRLNPPTPPDPRLVMFMSMTEAVANVPRIKL